MRKIHGAVLLGGLALAGCSPDVFDKSYQGYSIRLTGPDTAQVPAGSAGDPFTATLKYEVRVKYWEDAAGTIPYGTSLGSTKPQGTYADYPTATFKFGANRTTFKLGDADLALPHLKDGQSIFVQSEIVGLGDGDAPVARARCPVMELQPSDSGVSAKDVECKAFFGLIGKWNPIKAPGSGRYAFAAAGLPDGRVVIAGGKQSSTDTPAPLGSVEIYEPTTENADGTFGAWRKLSGQLQDARYELTGTASGDGFVFFAGGKLNDTNYSPKVDVFDATGPGSLKPAIGNLAVARAEHAASSFKDNSVILATGKTSQTSVNSNAEIVTSSQPPRSLTASNGPRSYACLAPVTSSQLVLCGGGTKSCESFDGTNFSPGGEMRAIRTDLRCASVGGQVFLIGGIDDANNRSIEMWAQGTVSTFDTAPKALLKHAAAVANGKVVVAGGIEAGTSTALKTGFWFDPKAGGVHEISGPGTEMTSARSQHQMVGLPDGTVMAIGGKMNPGDAKVPGAEIFVVPDAAN